MAVTVQMQFASVVTERYQDAFVGSSIENGTTVIQFDLRRHNVQQELGTQATLCWRKESSHVDVHELSTFHHPILYRFILVPSAVITQRVALVAARRISRSVSFSYTSIESVSDDNGDQ